MEEKINLCFIRLIGEANDGYYRYEFIFTNNIAEVFGENFEQCPCENPQKAGAATSGAGRV